MTRRRIVFFDEASQLFYVTAEYNGDKAEMESHGMSDGCTKTWGETMAAFKSVGNSLCAFLLADYEAQFEYFSSVPGQHYVPVTVMDSLDDIVADEVIHLNFEVRTLRRVSFRDLIGVLCSAEDNEVVTFSLSAEGDLNYGACFSKLYEGRVLTFGGWGDGELSGLPSLSARLFNTTQEELKSDEEMKRSIAKYLASMLALETSGRWDIDQHLEGLLALEGGTGLYLSPERYTSIQSYEER